ncbi:MAG: SH3 domain-containing protein [Bacteriovorax sp.]|nr:SH3 domain-containing protein [Bacteriovorax sp.]
MKKFLLFSLLFFGKEGLALEGVVIVLEAPLLKKPTRSSKVLMTLRKGARVYIPNEIFETVPLPSYIQTYDRVGNIAYIPSDYVKIITNELSEKDMPITYPGNDPTDYRLEETIPSTYPFTNTDYLRASLIFSLGNNLKSPYDYNSNYNDQSFSTETGVRLNVTRKIQFDRFDRYYFGFTTAITTNTNRIQFQNNNLANENRSVVRLGPLITYDVYKNANYRFTLGSGFTYNYHKTTLKVTAENGDSEERLFNGFSLSPFANTYWQVVDVFPSIDLLGGVDLNLYLPHTQKTKDQASMPEFWSQDSTDSIATGLKPQVSFFLGIQVKY